MEKLSNYCKIYSLETPGSVVLFSTKQASTVILPETMLEDIAAGGISQEEREALIDLGFLVSTEEEKSEILLFMEELNEMDRVFHAKIVMNLDCNLACTYCFEGRRKGRFYMTKETADRIVDFMRGDIFLQKEEWRFTFYGGEPLLSLELIAYLSGKLKAEAERNGVRYNGYIITNGTLLSAKTAHRLKALGLKEAAVTIDGPGNVHDLFRPFKTGKGSFDSIMRNVKEVCGTIKIQLGGNYTRENYRLMPLLLDYLIGEGLTPEKIPLVRFDPVLSERSGIAPPDFHEGCDCLNESWFYEASLFLREEILKREFGLTAIAPSPCMMEMRDRLLINYDGSIYKCPGLIGRKEFCVGDIWNGIRDYRESHNLGNWKNEECLNCAYLPLCFGGCRYMKFIRDGNMNGVDCRKPYFDACLEALVKQDIKYGLTAS